MSQPILNQIDRELKKAQNVLLFTHQEPDGDACGSTLSLFFYLRNLGKNAVIWSNDLPSASFAFLPGIENFQADRKLLSQSWDAAVALDCCDLRIVQVAPGEIKAKNLISIDHHWGHQEFAPISWLEKEASSTCELISVFFKFLNYPFGREIAICLFCGLMTDTGFLTNGMTSGSVVALAGELAAKGVNPQKIINTLRRNKTVAGLRLWGDLFSRLTINPKYNLVYSYVWEKELKKNQIKEEEVDGFINFLNSIAGVKLAAFLRIYNDRTKVSLRTTDEEIDLSSLAKIFGGGGHKKAAGFTLPWPLAEENGRLKV